VRSLSATLRGLRPVAIRVNVGTRLNHSCSGPSVVLGPIGGLLCGLLLSSTTRRWRCRSTCRATTSSSTRARPGHLTLVGDLGRAATDALRGLFGLHRGRPGVLHVDAGGRSRADLDAFDPLLELARERWRQHQPGVVLDSLSETVRDLFDALASDGATSRTDAAWLSPRSRRSDVWPVGGAGKNLLGHVLVDMIGVVMRRLRSRVENRTCSSAGTSHSEVQSWLRRRRPLLERFRSGALAEHGDWPNIQHSCRAMGIAAMMINTR